MHLLNTLIQYTNSNQQIFFLVNYETKFKQKYIFDAKGENNLFEIFTLFTQIPRSVSKLGLEDDAILKNNFVDYCILLRPKTTRHMIKLPTLSM